MNILYAIQATGNGHLSRAIELYPHLSKRANVDIFVSGTQGDLLLPFQTTFRRHGLSFVFGTAGRINYLKTIAQFKPLQLACDIRNCQVKDYDLVVNDFEPITAWACRQKRTRCLSVSHQAAFLSDRSPRPAKKSKWAEAILKYYAPADDYIGLHFQRYDEKITTPIIRSEIRRLSPVSEHHINVYLPAFHERHLIPIFTRFPDRQWLVFSKHSEQAYSHKNVRVYPVGSSAWLSTLERCEGVVIGGGFEGPSEALHLGKKLLVVPMPDQYEQQCNGAALSHMGVTVLQDPHRNLEKTLIEWLAKPALEPFCFPPQGETLAAAILRCA